jgi:hypothetical protein
MHAAASLFLASVVGAAALPIGYPVQEPQIDAFTLVADITRDGKLSTVDVRPATNIAFCFASGLTRISFPKPPRYPGHIGFPMTIEMRIK